MPEAPPGTILNVTRSVTGRRWSARVADDRLVYALAQSRNLPDLVCRILAARGVTLADVDSFLAPSLRMSLPDPSLLRDMDKAAARLALAVQRRERVAIFGDYDVDGATAAAVLGRFLRTVGIEPRIYIPNRMTEGYGPNAAALLGLQEEGAGLVVTVDCGTAAFAPFAAAAAAGLDVVVIDHHAAEPQLPNALAIVNPNRLDDDSGQGHLCAAGVAFLTVVALNRTLRVAGWYRDRLEPNLLDLLDLVALGTVCDVVPLTGVNRALVSQGIKVMAKRGNLGISALADAAGLRERPDAYHAGYILGPRINAGGRIGCAELGARLLMTDDPAEAARLAAELEKLNLERRDIESRVLEIAIAQAEEAPDEPVIFVIGDDWHPGVTGLVASRLAARFSRPACVVAVDGAEGKGSGRSVRGIDLGAAIIAARLAGLLVSGGGHPMAAGFTVDRARIEGFRAFLAARIASQVDAGKLEPTLELDGALTVGAASSGLAQTLARIGPFGSGNVEPRFALADARVMRSHVVGGGHIRCFLSGTDGTRLKAIAFRATDTALGRCLLKAMGQPLHLAGTLRLDTWQGRNDVQLFIEDAATVF